MSGSRDSCAQATVSTGWYFQNFGRYLRLPEATDSPYPAMLFSACPATDTMASNQNKYLDPVLGDKIKIVLQLKIENREKLVVTFQIMYF